MKKWILLTVSIIVCMMGTAHVFAQQNETILETVEISENQREVFIEEEGIYYKKILKKEEDQWRVIHQEKLQLFPTGLILEEFLIDEIIDENQLRLGKGFLPSTLDLSHQGYLPPVGTQWGDSCVGWATGYYLRTYQQAKDIGWQVANNPRHIFSPNFIYNQINGGVDRGARLSDAGNLLKEIGAATLYDFPIDPKDYRTQPSPEVKGKAVPHRIKDWYVLYTRAYTGEEILRKTKEYLNTGDLLTVGLQVGMKWMYPLTLEDGTSIVTSENTPLGGHAALVVGYDDNLPTPEGYGAFKILNSYGPEWGDEGYTYMTYEAFQKAIMYGYVYVDLENEPYVVEENLLVKITDAVSFLLQLSGNGRYDLRIKDPQGNPIKETLDQQGSTGTHAILWDGKDDKGDLVKEGEYHLELIPYKAEVPQGAIIIPFEKKSKIVFAEATLHGEEVFIKILPKESGEVSIYKVHDAEAIFINKETLKANQEFIYALDRGDSDAIRLWIE